MAIPPPRSFRWKDTNLKVACNLFEQVTEHIVCERRTLENYIKGHPEFQTSFEPVTLKEDAPEVARRMHEASLLTGLGPMASVAGTLAQLGVEKALHSGESDVLVENGGDLVLASTRTVVVGIFAGDNEIASNLAFRVEPETTPLAICSSSSRMGHSASLGKGDIATVVAKNAALADSVATMVCNELSGADTLQDAISRASAIEGVDGVFAVAGGKVGLCGNLPELIRNHDRSTKEKITRDRFSILP